jgi:ribosome recycling factor
MNKEVDVDYDEIFLDASERMEKAMEVLDRDLRALRSGRATPGLVDNIRVEYYGSPTPLRQLATISAPEPRLVVIKAFDPSSVKDIERAILKSELGITPSSDGKIIRLAIPPLSEERRRQVVNLAREKCEEVRVALRNVRRDAHRRADQSEKEKILSEDEARKLKDEVHDDMKSFEKKVDSIMEKKEKEIMKV